MKQKRLPSDILEKLIGEVQASTTIPMLALFTLKTKKMLDPYTSKFGGNPYLPANFEYPSYDKKPLKFLAQLNFSELPKIEGFPQNGILQFYLGPEALDDDNSTTIQDHFRVVYHEDIIKGTPLRKPPIKTPFKTLRKDEEHFVIKGGEVALDLESLSWPMTQYDFRFDDIVINLCAKYGIKIEHVYRDLHELDTQLIQETFHYSGSCVGGYPYFSEEDPRIGNKSIENHTTLLLQIDSDDKISIGEYGGVVNFFIKQEDLDNHDFSNVLFNYNCF